MSHRRLALAAALLVATFVAACSSSGDGGTQPGPTPAISIALSPTSATVSQGGSTQVGVTITRSGGFTGTVNVNVSGAPSGVSGTVSNVQDNSGVITATVTVGVDAATAPGTYTLTVQASGSGVSTVNGTFSLTVTAVAEASYTLTPTPSALSVAQGANGLVTVAIARTNFTGNVTLSAENLPTGVTAAFSPNPTGGTSSTLTITVAATAAAGQAVLAIRGTATGLADRTTAVTLTVTAGASYTLTPTPAALSIAQGANANVQIAIDRTNFTGNVTLAAENLPAGVTAAFSPNSTGGTASTLTLTASASATIGQVTVTVRGTASGLADRTTTVTLTVTTGSTGGSGNVTIDFNNCTLTGFPIWVAYQNGNGAWTRVTGSNNVYQFNITQSKWAFAWTPGAGIYVLFMSQADLPASGPLLACSPVGNKQVNGSVAGVGLTEFPYVNLGGSTAPSLVGTNFTISNVLSGPQDLIAYKANISSPGTNERVIIRRDQDIPNNGSTGTLDFNGSEAFAPVAANMTFAGGLVADDRLSATMTYSTRAACVVANLNSRGNLSTSGFAAFGIPGAQQRGDDFHGLFVSASSPTQGNRGSQQYFHTLADRAVTLPAVVPVPTVNVLSGPYRRLSADVTIPADYNTQVVFVYLQGTSSLPVDLIATVGWFGGSNGTLTMPDFSGVSGWNNAWVPSATATGTWILSELGRSTGLTAPLCVEGATARNGNRTGSY